MSQQGAEYDVRFDTAIPTLAEQLIADLGFDLAHDGWFLRDGFGRVAFFTPKAVAVRAARAFNAAAEARLGGYAFPSGALQLTDAASPEGRSVLVRSVRAGDRDWRVRLVDRRLIGRDWLSPPAAVESDAPPILTFGSLKGGVGRTTALFVLATHLARQGKNVLLIDLDLEAPGLSSLAFDPETGSRFGALEYLVESRLREISDEELIHYVGASSLTDRLGAQGRVDLLPATGTETFHHPQTMMAKLARAMVESPSPQGPILLSRQIAAMVRRFATARHYDAVLVDARAGLAELTAAPLLGLGGHIILFGTDHRHTFEGYRYLAAHLGLLAAANEGPEWRDRVHFVHAKASVRSDRLDSFNDQLHDTLADTFYDEDEGEEAFTFSLDEEPAPHSAWVIYQDATFQDGQSLVDPATYDSPIVSAVFGDFLSKAQAVLALQRVGTAP